MDSFERAFCETESAADLTIKAAGELTKLAKQLKKAARDGNITAIKRCQRQTR